MFRYKSVLNVYIIKYKLDRFIFKEEANTPLKTTDSEYSLKMEVKIRSITLGGKLGDAGFEQCRLALESISKTHPEISITINSFFETQWEEYLTYTKSIKGGDFYFHKGSPLTFYNENIYIGDLQPFLKWAQLKLRYFDHRSDYKKQSERNVMKVMKAGVISGNRGYVYMKIKLQGKTHQVVFELFQDLAPKSSLNFATLCEGKFKNEDNEIIGYKGSNVHRIVKGAYVQAGKMNISTLYIIYIYYIYIYIYIRGE